VDVGLQLAAAQPLRDTGETSDHRPTYELPALDRSWDQTLDTLRPPRERTEAFWEWRQRPPRPVTFHPLTRLSEAAEQLHLAHPFVRRILDRFLAQGFGAHDLSRVTALVAPEECHPGRRVRAADAVRTGGGTPARPDRSGAGCLVGRSGSGRALQGSRRRSAHGRCVRTSALATGAAAPNERISSRIRGYASALFSSLWPHVEAEADALGVDARAGLAQRARREADELRALLQRQQAAIDKAEARLRHADLFGIEDREQKRQVELDLRHLGHRRAEAASELESEPAAIEALYEVRMTRLSPVGLVVACPEAMT
jgi:hypothetical protein